MAGIQTRSATAMVRDSLALRGPASALLSLCVPIAVLFGSGQGGAACPQKGSAAVGAVPRTSLKLLPGSRVGVGVQSPAIGRVPTWRAATLRQAPCLARNRVQRALSPGPLFSRNRSRRGRGGSSLRAQLWRLQSAKSGARGAVGLTGQRGLRGVCKGSGGVLSDTALPITRNGKCLV